LNRNHLHLHTYQAKINYLKNMSMYK
jgi:hypothetical protein